MSSFFSDGRSAIVADASVAINLCATQRAQEIIRVLPHPFVMTEIACNEIHRGAIRGRESWILLQRLVYDGLIVVEKLGQYGESIYESLVSGRTQDTLDDGEAATISHAIDIAGVAMIDERKARRICLRRFPELEVVSTSELLLREQVKDLLGPQEQAEAVFRALKVGKMSVPTQHVAAIVSLIGIERMGMCSSLPRLAKQSNSDN